MKTNAGDARHKAERSLEGKSMNGPENGRAMRRTRRRNGWMAIALALFATAGGEVWATQYAQDRIADSVRRGIGLDSAPQVHVNGFPVSLQLARKKITEADIDAVQVPATVNGRVLIIQDLAVQLHGVHQEQGGRERADEAEATATIAYDDLSAFYGSPSTGARATTKWWRPPGSRCSERSRPPRASASLAREPSESTTSGSPRTCLLPHAPCWRAPWSARPRSTTCPKVSRSGPWPSPTTESLPSCPEMMST